MLKMVGSALFLTLLTTTTLKTATTFLKRDCKGKIISHSHQ